MESAWYERISPTPEYIREHEIKKNTKDKRWIRENQTYIKDIYTTFDETNITDVDFINVQLKKSIDKVITVERASEWGSFRGYATFGISDRIKEEIRETCMEKLKYSLPQISFDV